MKHLRVPTRIRAEIAGLAEEGELSAGGRER